MWLFNKLSSYLNMVRWCFLEEASNWCLERITLSVDTNLSSDLGLDFHRGLSQSNSASAHHHTKWDRLPLAAVIGPHLHKANIDINRSIMVTKHMAKMTKLN
jgi:hypothetical protein